MVAKTSDSRSGPASRGVYLEFDDHSVLERNAQAALGVLELYVSKKKVRCRVDYGTMITCPVESTHEDRSSWNLGRLGRRVPP